MNKSIGCEDVNELPAVIFLLSTLFLLVGKMVAQIDE